MIVLVIVGKKSAYEYVCNCEWLLRKLFECPDLAPLYFCLWGWTNRKVNKCKVDTWHKLLTHILDTVASTKNVQINSNTQYAIFAYELQSALRLTGFLTSLW